MLTGELQAKSMMQAVIDRLIFYMTYNDLFLWINDPLCAVIKTVRVTPAEKSHLIINSAHQTRFIWQCRPWRMNISSTFLVTLKQSQVKDYNETLPPGLQNDSPSNLDYKTCGKRLIPLAWSLSNWLETFFHSSIFSSKGAIKLSRRALQHIHAHN